MTDRPDDRRPAPRPRRYAEDVDLDAQFPGDDLRAPEPEYEAPEPVEAPTPIRRGPDMSRAPRPQDRQAPAAAPVAEDFPEQEWDEVQEIYVVKIEHDGLELTIPADPADWPIRATYAFENGKILNAIEALLSAKDFAKLMAKNYRNSEFGKLYERLAKAGGFDTSGN